MTVAFALPACATLLAGPEQVALAGRFFDDAFFYTKIADSFVENGALEFYPGMPTNGVQPLWMLCLIVMKTIFRHFDTLYLLLFVQTACVLGGTVLWFRLLRAEFGRSTSLLFLAITAASPLFNFWAFRGLETSLLWFVLPLLFLTINRASLNNSRWFVCGLLGGLLFLTRTDCAACVMGVAVMVWRQHGVRAAGVFSFGSAALGLPYLITNIVGYGSLLPLSGRAKQFYLQTYYPSFADYVLSAEWMGLADSVVHGLAGVSFSSYHALIAQVPSEILAGALYLLAALFTVGIIAVLLLAWARGDVGVGTMPPGGLVRYWASCCIFHILLLCGYHRGLRPYTSYYFLPEALLVALLLARLVVGRGSKYVKTSGWSRRWQGRSLGWVILGILGAAGVAREIPFWRDRLACAQYLRGLPVDATIGAYWPGALAYLSERDVMPLDGIIASREFQDRVMLTQSELSYLCGHSNPYLVISVGKPVAAFL